MRLNSIVKLDKLLALDKEAITKVWTAHAAFSGNPESFAMTLPATTAQLIQSTIQQYPSFILPVDKLTGKEIYFIQSAISPDDDNFTFNATPLEAFKSLGGSAPVSASLNFFMELAQEKSVSLLAGRFDGAQLNRTQVGSLVERIVGIWGRSNQRGFHWLQCFHERPFEFSFSLYLEEI